MDFSEEAREQIRQALIQHHLEFGMSPQEIAYAITRDTKFHLELDGGRKRVERFLKGTHKPKADFVKAVSDYLALQPPASIEEGVASTLQFFEGSPNSRDFTQRLLGYYDVRVRPAAKDGASKLLPTLPNDVEPSLAEAGKSLEDKFPIVYGTIEIRTLVKRQAQIVLERITYQPRPHLTEFHETTPKGAGVILSFGRTVQGYARFMLMTKSKDTKRFYHLLQERDDPLTLKGYLHIDQRGLAANVEHHFQPNPHGPDFEVALVKSQPYPD